MVNNLDDKNTIADTGTEAVESHTWQLSALSEALGDLTLTVSDSLSVGRGSDNDVVLSSKQVSRNHALLSVLNGKLYMKDLDSSNGTFINDDRIEANKSMPLNTDDHVSFASFSFQVKKPVAAATNANTSDDLSVEHSVLTAAPVTATETPSIDPTPMAMSNAEVTDAKAPLADLDTIAPLEAQPTISSPIEPIVEEETVIDTTFVDDGLSTNDPVATSTADESVVKETMIGEVLSSDMKSTTAPVVDAELSSTSVPDITTEQETVMSNDTAKVLLNSEPVVKESLVEEPLMKEPLMKEPLAVESTFQQKAVVEPEREKTTVTSSEHDKTTETALQEEADPDVLRAKQAATGQFSGTANLGQSRDIGTEGNNALDQAVNNSANAGHTEKKPSGSWFIWVFIAIIIIGLALWLFNMGGV